MVDVTYRNKKNGRVATVIQEDASSKSALVRYEDTDEEQQISFSTLKRWWEEVDEDDEDFDDEELDEDDIEDDDDEEYDDDDEEYGDEDAEEDEDEEDEDEEEDDEDLDDEEEDEEEEPVEEEALSKKASKQGKEKAVKSPKKEASAKKGNAGNRTKVDRTPVINEIRAVVEKLGFGWREYEKVSNFAVLTVSDHLKASIRFGSKKLTINVKEDIAETSKLDYRKMVYFLPAAIDFEYSASLKNDIKSLLTLVYKSASDSKKVEKKAAKKSTK